MNKKWIILCIIFIILFMVALVFLYKLNILNNNSLQNENIVSKNDVKKIEFSDKYSYSFDEVSNGYLIYDENNTVVDWIENQEDLNYYIKDPNYDPSNKVGQELETEDLEDEIMQ